MMPSSVGACYQLVRTSRNYCNISISIIKKNKGKRRDLQMGSGWNFKLMWFMWFAVIQGSDSALLLPQLLSQICLRHLYVTTPMVSFSVSSGLG